MKTCPNCSHENDESHLFCAKCGTKLDDTTQDEPIEKEEEIEEKINIDQPEPAQTTFIETEKTKYCPNCGKPVNKSATTCPNCGERLAVPAPKPLIIPTEANIAVLLSIFALVYSICGAITLTGVALGILSIYLGSKANKIIGKELIYGGRDRAIAGIVMGAIAISLNIIFLIIWSVMFSSGLLSNFFDETIFL
jgi:DNA-directed RNA polymerase subunit RPC12/RpoP